MAIPQTDVIGPLVLPDGTAPFGARLKFELIKWDKDSGETILMGPVFADCDASGDFTAPLWPSTEGVNSTSYAVSATYYNGGQDKVITEPLGFITVPTLGPVLLADLLTTTATPITTPEGLALMAAYLAAAEAAEASAAAAAAIATAAVANIKIEYSTLADMVADSALTVGTFVKTLGYWAAGDGGDNVYEIVAAATGTADGGSFIDLTGSGFQARGIFGGNTVHVAKFGATGSLFSGPTGDVSARVMAASAYAVALRTATTPSSAINFVMSGVINLSEPTTIGGTTYFNVNTLAAYIHVIAGGDLEANPEQTALTVISPQSEHHFGVIDCNHICGGLRLSGQTNSRVFGPRLDHFTWRGLTVDILDGNCAGAIINGVNGREWGTLEPEFADSASFVSTGIYNDTNDIRFISCHIGYCGVPFINGPAGNGATFLECHPFNGNPNAGSERLNPIDFINYCPNRVWMYDCYIDNGNIIDFGGTLAIKNSWDVSLNAEVPDPVIRIAIPDTADDMVATAENCAMPVGYFSHTWMGSTDAEPIVLFAMGQSNMNGNADAADGATFQVNKDVYLWNVGALGVGSGEFITPVYGSHPLTNGGECLAITIANRLQEVHRRPVYVVLMARGSTNAESWISPATNTANGWTADYDVTANAYPAFAAALAAVPGRTTAYADYVAWHQGEANGADSSTVYRDKFLAMQSDLEAQGVVHSFRTRFTAGGLLEGVSNRATIEAAILLAANLKTNIFFAESDGLAAGSGSLVHFSGQAIREFADRYYWATVVVPNFNVDIAGMTGDNKRVTSRGRHTIISLNDSDNVTRHEVRGGGASQFIEHQYSGGKGARSNVRYREGRADFFNPANGFGEVRVNRDGGAGIVSDSVSLPLAFKTGGSIKWRITGNGAYIPEADNVYNIGTGGLRVKEIFCANGTINTSDKRHKTNIEPINDTLLDAWAGIEWSSFRWVDSVAEKGDDARVHFGLIAQDIKEVFEAAGLDPFKYGVLCFDEWDEETDADGNVTLEAGNRYGVRYDQAQAIEAAYMRRELKLLRGKKK